MNIREFRLTSINQKVFSLTHINELATILWEEYEKEKKSGSNLADLSISFSVKCIDRSVYESEHPTLFSKGSIVEKKNTLSITMNFQKGKEKLIKVNLEHGYRIIDNKYENASDIEIGGENNFWVSGISDKIEVLLNSIPDQEGFYFKYEKYFDVLYFLIGGLGIMGIIDYSNRNEKDFVSILRSNWDSVDGLIGLVFLTGIIGFLSWAILSNFVTKQAYNLWPLIELQLGPEHLQKERKKRAFLGRVLGLVIIPLLLSIGIEFWFNFVK